MSMAIALFWVVSLSAVCVSSLHAQQSTTHMSSSEDASIQQRAAVHMHGVRGAENPTAIPLGIKFRKFFRHAEKQLLTDAGRNQLKAALRLTQADWDLLTAAAQRDRSVRDAIAQAGQRQMQDVCQRVSAGNLEPAEIGRSLTEAEDQNEQDLSQHYKALVDQLSADGQRALLSYVDSIMSRSLSYGRIDFEGLLAEFPELAAQVVRQCADPAAPVSEETETTRRG